MAQDKIKGLTIEFNSNATTFNKGLTQMNRELNQVGKTANAIQKQIDNAFDPADITPFTKKLDLVSTELEGTEKKAELLRKELENVEDTDLNSQEVLKLEQNLAKAETEAGKLRKEQERLNNDIKSLETQEYDKLSTKTKKAAKNTGTLTDEQLGFTKAIKETQPEIEKTSVGIGDLADVSGASKTALGEMGGALVGITSKLGALGIAAGVAGGAVTLMYHEFQQTNEASLALAGDITLLNKSAKDLNYTASAVSKTFGVEYEEGIDIAKTASKLFGKELYTSTGAMDSYITTVGLMNLENVDLERGISAIDKAQTNFNISQKEGVALLISAAQAVQQFGGSADDLLDAYVEFGDTAAYAKLSAQEYFEVLNTGLILGAKNYDEVANALNELILRTEAGTDGTKEAFASIGLSWETVSNQISDGKIQQVLINIITGLAEVDNKTAISAEIFGTYGEEFVATLASNTEAVDALVESQDIQLARQDLLNESSLILKENMDNYTQTLGLTNFQQSNLKTAMEEGNGAAINYLQQIGLLDETVGYLGSKLGLTEGQQAILNTALDIANTKGGLAAQQYLSQAGALQFLADKNIVAKDQAKLYEDAQKNVDDATKSLTTKVKNLTTDIANNGEQYGLSAKETETFKTELAKANDTSKTAEYRQWALEKAARAGADAFGLSKSESAHLANDLRRLTDDTLSTTEKQELLTKTIDKFGLDKAPALRKELEKLEKGYQDLNTPLADTADSTNDMTDDIIQLNKKLSPTPGKVDDLKENVEDSIDPFNRFSGAIAGAGTNLGTLNQQIDNINQKSVNVPSVSVGTPETRGARSDGLNQLAPLKQKFNFKDINVSITANDNTDTQQLTNNITDNIVQNIVEEIGRRY